MTVQIELRKIQEGMESNGYAHFDDDAFMNNLSRPCYIPENAEELEDCFNRRDLCNSVIDWLEYNEWYIEEHKPEGCTYDEFVEGLVVNMYETLEWEFPSTWLDQRSY
jgi:hypothetical protein